MESDNQNIRVDMCNILEVTNNKVPILSSIRLVDDSIAMDEGRTQKLYFITTSGCLPGQCQFVFSDCPVLLNPHQLVIKNAEWVWLGDIEDAGSVTIQVKELGYERIRNPMLVDAVNQFFLKSTPTDRLFTSKRLFALFQLNKMCDDRGYFNYQNIVNAFDNEHLFDIFKDVGIDIVHVIKSIRELVQQIKEEVTCIV